MYRGSQSGGGEGRGRWEERENRVIRERDKVERKSEGLGLVVVRSLEVGYGDLKGEHDLVYCVFLSDTCEI